MKAEKILYGLVTISAVMCFLLMTYIFRTLNVSVSDESIEVESYYDISTSDYIGRLYYLKNVTDNTIAVDVIQQNNEKGCVCEVRAIQPGDTVPAFVQMENTDEGTDYVYILKAVESRKYIDYSSSVDCKCELVDTTGRFVITNLGDKTIKHAEVVIYIIYTKGDNIVDVVGCYTELENWRGTEERDCIFSLNAPVDYDDYSIDIRVEVEE